MTSISHISQFCGSWLSGSVPGSPMPTIRQPHRGPPDRGYGRACSPGARWARSRLRLRQPRRRRPPVRSHWLRRPLVLRRCRPTPSGRRRHPEELCRPNQQIAAGRHRVRRWSASRGAIRPRRCRCGSRPVAHQLGRLTGLVDQPLENRNRDLGQRETGLSVLTQADKSRTECVSTFSVAAKQSMLFEGPGEAMGGGSAEAAGFDELRKRPWTSLDRVDQHHRLVNHANCAYDASHKTRLSSQYMR